MADESPRITQPRLRARLAGARVAVLGCGGLGSNCAVMLVRTGVTRLVLVDDDTVSEDNLNRQHFFLDQVGAPKVRALTETLRRIDQRVQIDAFAERIDEASLPRFVADCDAIVEAVDAADTKALIVSSCTREFPGVPLVSASGLAGVGSANAITTGELGEHVWVCGDMVTGVGEGHALTASRVMVAAAHQAHAVVRELLGLRGG